MKKAQYQILRYQHDQTTGEFVNVGIVLYCKEDRFLEARFITKYGRLSGFFGELNGPFLMQTLKHLKQLVDKLSYELKSSESVQEDIDSITRKVLPPDNSALAFTEIKNLIDVDMTSALEDRYENLVNKYMPTLEKDRITDQQVWSRLYKGYFDKLGITEKLREHTVNTQHDAIHFDKAWKNGVWNCYQPLSLALEKTDSIKSKIYKWAGILRELEHSASEPIHLYFLTTHLKQGSGKLDTFISETLGSTDVAIKVKIVSEENAEQFAKEVKKQMEQSEE